ncbi:hypothetical protein HAX54_043897 [Datura stramonium]|uniref:Secreted protein n=1 Tax=Datura stramonium TaxID=4076 RepID=A0ABS8W1W8_DATST|nr:hypothetical protein [Datura stramonium]
MRSFVPTNALILCIQIYTVISPIEVFTLKVASPTEAFTLQVSSPDGGFTSCFASQSVYKLLCHFSLGWRPFTFTVVSPSGGLSTSQLPRQTEEAAKGRLIPEIFAVLNSPTIIS